VEHFKSVTLGSILYWRFYSNLDIAVEGSRWQQGSLLRIWNRARVWEPRVCWGTCKQLWLKRRWMSFY